MHLVDNKTKVYMYTFISTDSSIDDLYATEKFFVVVLWFGSVVIVVIVHL
jgi:hypothetical protein